MIKNKKTFIMSVTAIIVIGIAIFLSYISKPDQTIPPILTLKTVPEVIISTDKNDYKSGESISIVVENELNKQILYNPGGDRSWGIEYYEGGEWKKYGYEGRKGFQLTNENIGDNCYIALYELSYPIELQPQSDLKFQWNQKICPFGTEGPDKPKIVRYIESGKYRATFSYGFEVSDDDRLRILDPRTIYSNIFTIE